MSERHRTPSARRAVDLLAQLGPDVLADMIETAIGSLDGTENAEAEHPLGWSIGHAGQLRGAPGGDNGTDLEEDDSAEEDDPQGDESHDADCEPLLAWRTTMVQDIPFSDIGDDREADGADDERSCDDDGVCDDTEPDGRDRAVGEFGNGSITGPNWCSEVRL